MCTLRVIPPFFAAFYSIIWSAAAQTGYEQTNRPRAESVWLVLAEQPTSGVPLNAFSSQTVENAPIISSFAFHRQADALLLHLKNERNQVRLQVTDIVGNAAQISTYVNLSGGFYELPLLPRSDKPTLHVLKLIINQEVVRFHATL